MHFQNPLALLLLLALIPVYLIGRPDRGYGRGRERASLILRILIVSLLVLAAAGPELRRGSDALAVVFLVDASDSLSSDSRQAAEAFVARSLESMGPDDQAAVVLFGAEALVDRAMSPGKILTPFRSIPDPSETDIAEAVRLGMALFPSGAARRMVLITDGAQTAGDAAAAARLAADSGVEFLVVPLGEQAPDQEVALLDIDLPSRLIQGEAFDLNLILQSRTAAQAFVRVFAGGALVFEGAAQLEPGSQSYRIPLTAGEAGFMPYTVQISSPEDTHFQNNELAAYSRIDGPPAVLLVAPEPGEPLPFSDETRPDEHAQLEAVLLAAGFSVDVVRPEGLPFELTLLSEYASVILVDVPARQLSNRQMTALQAYVRDLGGGLLAVGGPTAYGVGGYFRTPLEETLPVDMEVKDEERRPNLVMVFVIDRSGSMGDTSGSTTKLELAKEAAIRSVELLFPGDKIGVIAFDDSASWVVPITDLAEPEETVRAIESIGIGGGTDILAGLQAMAAELPQDDSSVKHVILLTDGGANPAGIPELVERMFQEYGITLTSVGVGPDAAPFLEDLASLGGGRYHFTDRPESIPSIFTEETTLATRSYIVEEPFFPVQTARSPILAQVESVPPLYGYVAATTKTTAQQILSSELGDPILAAWQYGLGRAVAWTSDATARWAQDWVAWEGFPLFWSQAVRYTITDQQRSPLRVAVEAAGGSAVLTVEAVSGDGDYLNRYDITATIVRPDGEASSVPMDQTAPGQYQAVFHPQLEGAYLLRIDGADDLGENSVSELTGWVRAYSPEYRLSGEDAGFLNRLAEASRGALAALDAPSAAFVNPGFRATAARPLWQEFLSAALLLLPFDIGVRRLALERRDLVRAWERLAARLVRRPAPAGGEPVTAERMSTLLRAKDRVEERLRSQQEDPAPPRQAQGSRQPKPPAETLEIPAPGKPADAPPAPEPAPSPEDPDGDLSTTAALLARKRARKRRDQHDRD